MTVAHGASFVGAGLPVPPLIAIYGAAIAVLVSFGLLVGARARRPRRSRGLVLPGLATRIVDSRITRGALKGIGLGLLAVTLVSAWIGPQDAAANPAPTWMYVWFWIGLAPLSALCGPVWRTVNPLRPLARTLATVVPVRRNLPERVGYWPAVASLTVFLWLELVYDGGTDPRTVAWFITLYTAVHALAGAVFGDHWFDKADGFEAYSTLLGRLAPLSRGADGRLRIANPLTELARTPDGRWQAPGLVTFVALLLGSTVFDGISRTNWWTRTFVWNGASGDTAMLWKTVGLCASVAFVRFLYVSALRTTRPQWPSRTLEDGLIYTLLPISLGLTVAHYASYLLYQGQVGFLLASDPLGWGWDLFGGKGQAANFEIVRPDVLAVFQLAAIVAGHVIGAVCAHDRLPRLVPATSLRKVEFPLVALMVALTVGGVTVLANT